MPRLEQIHAHCRRIVLSQSHADSAHDLAHIERVVNLAVKFAKAEGANSAVVCAAAWLHDLVQLGKQHPERHLASRYAADKAREELFPLEFDNETLDAIHHAIVAHSFSAKVPAESLEAKIVQDADRLDAIGALGIARCFTVGGALSRALFHPSDPLAVERPLDDSQYTLDHFYVKLLKIKDNLHTQAAKREAEKRTEFMQGFIAQLHEEIQC